MTTNYADEDSFTVTVQEFKFAVNKVIGGATTSYVRWINY